MDLKELHENGKLLEEQRLKERTMYDLEMLRETGFCHGIENYSRHIDKRKPNTKPYCLMDYFPEDFLLFIASYCFSNSACTSSGFCPDNTAPVFIVESFNSSKWGSSKNIETVFS